MLSREPRMSYQVLARKFRPGTFAEVVGQDAAVKTLRNAIAGGRLAHAYLFSGGRGVGKTTLARILAKCLNCHAAAGPTVDPCGTCPSCTEIAESTCLDVQEIDGASNRGIDDVRELRETSRYQPSRDRHRIFIIDEVHMLTREAFNALLKTLEEPPPHVVFIFATTEYQKVPATISSRCQHFDFRRIERAALAATLLQVAAKEGIALDERGADLLARSASGSLRDALGYLDQAIAYCGREITEEGLREILGVAGIESVDAYFDGIAARDAGALLRLIDRLARHGQDLAHYCRELVERGRELLLLRATDDGAAVLGLTAAEAEETRRRAEAFSPEDLLRICTALTDLEARMRLSQQPRFLLEMAALRMVRSAPVVPLADLVARVEALAGGGTAPPEADAGGGRAAPPPRPGARRAAPSIESRAAEALPDRPAPEPPPLAEAGLYEPPPPPGPAGSAEEEVRRRVAAKRSALGSYLEHAIAFRVEADRLVIRFPARHSLFKNGLARADNREIVAEAVREAIGRDLKIDVGIAAEGDPEAPSASDPGPRERPQDALMSRALEEPTVRAFMERFGARVVRIEEAKPS
jgi:DNA polymerase-3 subunit gamma/tau